MKRKVRTGMSRAAVTMRTDEGLGRPRERGEEVFDLGEVGERADVEAEVHQLEEDEEGVDDVVGVRGGLGRWRGCGRGSWFEGQGSGS